MHWNSQINYNGLLHQRSNFKHLINLYNVQYLITKMGYSILFILLLIAMLIQAQSIMVQHRSLHNSISIATKMKNSVRKLSCETVDKGVSIVGAVLPGNPLVTGTLTQGLSNAISLYSNILLLR